MVVASNGVAPRPPPPSQNGLPPQSSSQPSLRAKSETTNGSSKPQVPLSARRAERLDMSTVDLKGRPLNGPRDSAVKRRHISDIPEAPTYYPTEEQWRNPFEYIQSIADEGKKYGIIKLIPPDAWNPPFAIDTERFHFRTRKQELNSCEGGTRANLNYLDQLAKFHKQHGTNLNRFPSVDKRMLDLYKLRNAVESRGGFERVCKGKKWAEIGRELGYSGKIMSSLSTSLKNSYARWLEPYESWLRGAKPNVQMQLEQERGGPFGTPSPVPSPMKKSNAHTPSSLSRESPAMKASHVLQESMFAPITYSETKPAHASPSNPATASGFTAANAAGFTPINKAPPKPISFTPVNTPNGFQHEIASKPTEQPQYGPIGGYAPIAAPIQHDQPASLKRSISDSQETDLNVDANGSGRRSKRLKKDEPPTVTGSHMQQPRSSTPRPSLVRDHDDFKPGEKCETCRKGENEHKILICESCYHGFHTYCLDPPLTSVPEHDWHCSRCLVGTGEFGFEEGGIYSLKKFQAKAHFFRERHFAKVIQKAYDPVHNAARPPPITEDDVEREFWRLVQSLTETVEVEYGADIHSTIHGSGFPTIERNPRDAYSTDPWNLNNLPLHQQSLFRHIKSDISGMTVPWLYVGMVFSTFCWHNEDHYTYSANYQHFGATKTWYGIPGADALRFEEAMKEAVPELFEQQPDLLFQLVTLLTPDQLRKAGVNVYAVDQRAGQFVITFPQAYHAGFNHGFNFNEAVNFAPSDWEPFGRDGVDRLREFRRQPCFSHNELLLTAAGAKDFTIKTAKWLAPALEQMLEKERQTRAELEPRAYDGTYYKSDGEGRFKEIPYEFVNDGEDLIEEEYVCSYCKTYSYLSRWKCEKTKKIACPEHIEIVNCCDGLEGHSIHYRLLTSKLEQIYNKVQDKADLPEKWIAKFEDAVEGNPKPQLKTLRSLLSEGERIPWNLPQLTDLKRFVERCNEWVEEAINYISRKQQNRKKNEKLWRRGSQAKAAELEERDKELRKLSNMKKLLADADQIGFDCPEITTLQERMNAITAFQLDARKAIDSISSQKIADLEPLIEIGKGFSVEIPEVDHLEKLVRQMKWVERASDKSQNRTLMDVEELLSEAKELNVPETNQHLTEIKRSKEDGAAWEEKAKQLMAVENINFAQLDSFSKQAAGLPVSKEVLSDIDAILKKQREAQDQIVALHERCSKPDLRDRPQYKEVRDLMETINEMNSKPSGAYDLETQQKRHENWMRRGKKLFGKTNAPLHILLQHMEYVRGRNESCFDIEDKPRMPVEPSSREGTPDGDVDGQSSSNKNVFCMCRTPEASMMIECTVCHEWYHGRCLKIARGKVKEDDDFMCPICDWRVKIPRDATRPKLEDLIAWQAEIKDLPFQPDEEECHSNIIDTAQDYRNFLVPYTNPVISTIEEVPTLRFYLRKIEGAEIMLASETNFFRQELHRLYPIAPDPPPHFEVSLSTRKPRPTKQQKLMAAHGVENPEDLPQHLRTKPYNVKRRKTNEDPSQLSLSQSGTPDGGQGNSTTTQYTFPRNSLTQNRSNSHTPAQLNFKPPLTATEFPRKSTHSHSNSRQSDGELFSNSGGAELHFSPTTANLPPMSPAFLNAASASTSPTHNPNLDPHLFGSSFLGQDSPNQQTPGLQSRGDPFANEDSSPTQNSNFESIFAEMTNQDDERTDGQPGMNNVDPALL